MHESCLRKDVDEIIQKPTFSLCVVSVALILEKIGSESRSCLCTKCTFFARLHALLGRPRVVSRAVGCGTRKGAACTPGASLGPGRAPCRAL